MSKMKDLQIEEMNAERTGPHALRNLDQLSIDNLKCGRITRDAMHEAAARLLSRLPKGAEFIPIGSNGRLSTHEDMLLADELNEMLETAKELSDKEDNF